jgi:uncharacterized protein (DUF952 family)
VAGRLVIFHITTRAEWDAAVRDGEYTAPSLATEGFIHLSNRHQVAEVANARYRGVPDLVLLGVDPERLAAPLRYEVGIDSDERFPHLYGPLELAAVSDVLPFPEGPDGFAPPD